MNLPDIRPSEFVALWCELDDAYYGKNGYGGDTAELYAYRFEVYCPTRHGVAGRAGTASPTDWMEAFAKNASRLLDLLTLFASVRDCFVLIGERKIGKWVLAMQFDHRVHVRVQRKRSDVRS